MPNRTYWLDLFTATTWNEFLAAGGTVSGFRESRWSTVKKIKQSDWFLCYLTGLSRFVGILEVISGPFKDDSPIWKDEEFPCRVKVKVVSKLTYETAVPILEMKDQLSFFQNLTNPHSWTGSVRGSPARWKQADGQAVVRAVLEAEKNPIARHFDKRKLKYRPKAIATKIGQVTIPDDPEEEPEVKDDQERSATHTEIQWRLLRFGADMGLDVWVARNDRNRQYKGQLLSALPRVKDELPLQFDEATTRTIELIDVLWLKGTAIMAAFEIENTTQIYSGLLRMADLLAMQPNLNIPLYIVAPDERREKVMNEVNRPTFSRFSPPLKELCRFISYSSLLDNIRQTESFLRYLKPDLLEEVSESCDLEDI